MVYKSNYFALIGLRKQVQTCKPFRKSGLTLSFLDTGHLQIVLSFLKNGFDIKNNIDEASQKDE